MDVVEKRQTVWVKKYNSMFGNISIFFGVPKIVLTIAITLLLFSVLKIGVYSEWILLAIVFY
jgi:hypothetical protein